MYTLFKSDGSREVGIEEIYGKIESDFFPTLRRLEAGEQIDSKDRSRIAYFLSAQAVRTPAFRDHWKSQLGRIVDQVTDLEEWARTATREQKERMSRVSILRPANDASEIPVQSIKDAHLKPLQLVGVPMFIELVKILDCMHMTIVYTDDVLGYITSDCPVSISDPALILRPPVYRQISLLSPTVEISMPLSPSFYVVFTYNNALPESTKANSTTLLEFNRSTRFNAHSHFITKSKITEPYWFFDTTPLCESYISALLSNGK